MITTGAICISEVLGKCSLQVLDISLNKIGDEGITVIAGTLSNSQISELNVRGCDITLTGARSLVNNSVRILNVSGNPITVEGACLILQSAVNNGVCQEVVIYDEVLGKLMDYEDYRHDDEVKMIILKQRKRQEVGASRLCFCDNHCHGNTHRSHSSEDGLVGDSISSQINHTHPSY